VSIVPVSTEVPAADSLMRVTESDCAGATIINEVHINEVQRTGPCPNEFRPRRRGGEVGFWMILVRSRVLL
jgi:hypothetical protein